MPKHPIHLAGARKVSTRAALVTILSALISAFALQHYVVAIYTIEGTSMWPTLNDGDLAMVNMLSQRLGPLSRGEIVLVRDGHFQEYATKRIIGLPGELIEFRDHQVWINRKPLREPYLSKETLTESEFPAFLLGQDEYFVLGDNRPDSYDSRSYGPVDRASIKGSYTRAFWACR